MTASSAGMTPIRRCGWERYWSAVFYVRRDNFQFNDCSIRKVNRLKWPKDSAFENGVEGPMKSPPDGSITAIGRMNRETRRTEVKNYLDRIIKVSVLCLDLLGGFDHWQSAK